MEPAGCRQPQARGHVLIPCRDSLFMELTDSVAVESMNCFNPL